MKYPNYKTYEILYKNHFKRTPMDLILKAGLNLGDTIFDVCGGGGRLSSMACDLGYSVVYLDAEKRMMSSELNEKNIIYFNLPIEKFLKEESLKYKEYFKAIFCQQAINYWFNNIDMKDISNLLKHRGKFIFNTFNRKPSEEKRIKNYNINDIDYSEVINFKNNKIYHIQRCRNLQEHKTVFPWISEEEFLNKLNPYFSVDIENDKLTSIYICTKRKEELL